MRTIMKVVSHLRVRRTELPHLFAAQRERARQSLVDSQTGLEVADTNNRTSSSRCATLDGGWNSGTVSPEGLSINWEVDKVPSPPPGRDMEQSVQLAVAKETRDHQVLLKIRPALLRQGEWTEACEVLREIVVKEGGEVKTGVAPPNPLIRQLQ